MMMQKQEKTTGLEWITPALPKSIAYFACKVLPKIMVHQANYKPVIWKETLLGNHIVLGKLQLTVANI